jgi:hypothetical protein
MRVFISHSSKDYEFVESRLVPFLQSNGVQTWCSTAAIRTDEQWEGQIREALRSSDYLLVVLSPHSIHSAWVRAEVHWALTHLRGRVVPVLLSPCDPAELHLQLPLIQYIDLSIDDQKAWRALVKTLGVTSPLLNYRVYCSSLDIGALGVNRGYLSSVIPTIELDAARKVWAQLRDAAGYETAIASSPPPGEEPVELSDLASNLFVIGGPVHNTLARRLQERTELPLSFRKVDDAWVVVHRKAGGEEFLQARKHTPPRELGFIQHLNTYVPHRQSVIWCAGTGSGATYSAIEYWCTHWQELHGRHGGRGYSLCFALYGIARDQVDSIPPAGGWEVMFQETLSEMQTREE